MERVDLTFNRLSHSRTFIMFYYGSDTQTKKLLICGLLNGFGGPLWLQRTRRTPLHNMNLQPVISKHRKASKIPCGVKATGTVAAQHLSSPEICPGVWTWAWPPLPSGWSDTSAPPASEERRRRWFSPWCRSGQSRSCAPSRAPSHGPRWSSWGKPNQEKQPGMYVKPLHSSLLLSSYTLDIQSTILIIRKRQSSKKDICLIHFFLQEFVTNSSKTDNPF